MPSWELPAIRITASLIVEILAELPLEWAEDIDSFMFKIRISKKTNGLFWLRPLISRYYHRYKTLSLQGYVSISNGNTYVIDQQWLATNILLPFRRQNILINYLYTGSGINELEYSATLSRKIIFNCIGHTMAVRAQTDKTPALSNRLLDQRNGIGRRGQKARVLRREHGQIV